MSNTSEAKFITEQQRSLLLECLTGFEGWFRDQFLSPIRSAVAYFSAPPEIQLVTDMALSMRQAISVNPPIPLKEEFYPMAKRAVMHYRRYRATEIELRKQMTHNADLLSNLENILHPFDGLINQDWLKDVPPFAIPRLVDYLSVQQVDQILANKDIRPAEAEYDEGFHILRAPQLFLKDLSYYRAKCEIRNVPLIVAWMDIDDFKKLNSKYLHLTVDRNILLRLMESIEAHVFSHGLAYRKSGDEYKIILPNMTSESAARFLDRLRIDLSGLEYRDIQDHTTVSIGFCEVGPESFFTDREVDDLANKAMDFAKKPEQGKNCIATFDQSNDLYLVHPDP